MAVQKPQSKARHLHSGIPPGSRLYQVIDSLNPHDPDRYPGVPSPISTSGLDGHAVSKGPEAFSFCCYSRDMNPSSFDNHYNPAEQDY
jgi:hypothetical protein